MLEGVLLHGDEWGINTVQDLSFSIYLASILWDALTLIWVSEFLMTSSKKSIGVSNINPIEIQQLLWNLEVKNSNAL